RFGNGCWYSGTGGIDNQDQSGIENQEIRLKRKDNKNISAFVATKNHFKKLSHECTNQILWFCIRTMWII
ncbi:MAG TPA: hypothetical protein VFD29_07560, partial [Gillisia sp.]|nr:hypothetical protein [Gillisia sp.]